MTVSSLRPLWAASPSSTASLMACSRQTHNGNGPDGWDGMHQAGMASHSTIRHGTARHRTIEARSQQQQESWVRAAAACVRVRVCPGGVLGCCWALRVLPQRRQRIRAAAGRRTGRVQAGRQAAATLHPAACVPQPQLRPRQLRGHNQSTNHQATDKPINRPTNLHILDLQPCQPRQQHQTLQRGAGRPGRRNHM